MSATYSALLPRDRRAPAKASLSGDSGRQRQTLAFQRPAPTRTARKGVRRGVTGAAGASPGDRQGPTGVDGSRLPFGDRRRHVEARPLPSALVTSVTSTPVPNSTPSPLPLSPTPPLLTPERTLQTPPAGSTARVTGLPAAGPAWPSGFSTVTRRKATVLPVLSADFGAQAPVPDSKRQYCHFASVGRT